MINTDRLTSSLLVGKNLKLKGIWLRYYSLRCMCFVLPKSLNSFKGKVVLLCTPWRRLGSGSNISTYS